MGVIRAEPARVTDWAAKSVGAVWRAFDLQLVTYAGPARRRSASSWPTRTASRTASSRSSRRRSFTRGLMWAGDRGRRLHRRDGVRLSLAQDPRVADLRPPARAARADAGHRRRRRQLGALDRDRPVHVPVQRARQDPHDHRPGELPRGAPGPPRLARVDPRCLPARRAAAGAGDAPAGPRDVARLRRDPGRHALDVRAPA